MKQPNRTICVVADDDPIVLKRLEQAMGDSHCFDIVKPFDQLAPALLFIERNPVSLFITDIEFPHGELSYNHLSRISHTPVILISTYGHHFLRGYSTITRNKNVVGTVKKPITDETIQDILELHRSIQQQGMDKSAIKSTATNQTILLQRENSERQVEIRYSQIAMINSSRSPRGLAFYLNDAKKPYYLIPGQLQPCFNMLNRQCPGLFFLIPHTGIANLWNMTLNGNTLIASRSEIKHQLAVPASILPVLKKVTMEWSM